MAIYSAQAFAERYNFKFVFANGYMENECYKDYFTRNEVSPHLINHINWNNYFPTQKEEYKSFLEKLVMLDNIVPEGQHYYSYYQNLPWPGTYLNNCVHPTIEGYKVIAEELYSFIKTKNYV
jgi:lysophospholipase L1-like esterase